MVGKTRVSRLIKYTTKKTVMKERERETSGGLTTRFRREERKYDKVNLSIILI